MPTSSGTRSIVRRSGGRRRLRRRHDREQRVVVGAAHVDDRESRDGGPEVHVRAPRPLGQVDRPLRLCAGEGPGQSGEAGDRLRVREVGGKRADATARAHLPPCCRPEPGRRGPVVSRTTAEASASASCRSAASEAAPGPSKRTSAMSAPCEVESSSRRGATLSASVGLEGGGGDSEVTVGGGCCSVFRASSFPPSSRRSTAANAPPATSNTTTAPTAIQLKRRFRPAGGVGGASTGDGDSTSGSTRGSRTWRCRLGRVTVSRRQQRAAAPAVPRALGLLVAATRTGQRLCAVLGHAGSRLLGRRQRRAAVPAEPRAPPALRCRSSRRSHMRQAWPQLVQNVPPGRRSAPQFSQ